MALGSCCVWGASCHQVGLSPCQKFNRTGLALSAGFGVFSWAVWSPGPGSQLGRALRYQLLPLAVEPHCCLSPCSPRSLGGWGGDLLRPGTQQGELGELLARHSCPRSRGPAATSRHSVSGCTLPGTYCVSSVQMRDSRLDSMALFSLLHEGVTLVQVEADPKCYIIQAVRFLDL